MTKLASTVFCRALNALDIRLSKNGNGSVSQILPWIIALAVLCAGSLWLRIEHVNGAIPYVHHIDELQVSSQAAHMLTTGDFKPENMLYPSLPKYVAMAGMYLGFLYESTNGDMKQIGEIGNVGYPYYDAPGVVKFARYLFVLLSVGTLVAVGITAWLLLQRASALLLAPLVLATSWTFLQLATKYLNVDNVGTCFVVVSAASLLYGTRRRSIWFLAVVPAIFAGLAAGSKYTHGLMIGPILIAIYLFAESGRHRALAACLVASAAAFIVVVPHSVLDLPQFLKALAWQAKTYSTGWHGGYEAGPGLEQLTKYTKYFAGQFGIGGLLLAGVGLAACARHDWRRTLIFASFPVILVLLFIAQRVHFTRNMLPVLPFLAVFIVAGLYALHGRVMWAVKEGGYASEQLHRVTRWGAWPILIIVFLTVPIERVSKRHIKITSDSRHDAVAWIGKNIPTNSTIIIPNSLGLDPRPLESWGYPIQEMDFMALDSRESLLEAIAKTPRPVAVLSPRWGVDPRFEGKELAGRLNEAATQFEPAASFGKRPVLVNYRYPVIEPDPRFDIVVR